MPDEPTQRPITEKGTLACAVTATIPITSKVASALSTAWLDVSS